MATLQEKIQQAENVYKDTLKRLQAIEDKIKTKKFPEDKEKLLKTELEEVRKTLTDHEAHIRHLKTHSRRYFVVLVLFMGVSCALFMIYVLIYGPPVAGNTEKEFANAYVHGAF